MLQEQKMLQAPAHPAAPTRSPNGPQAAFSHDSRQGRSPVPYGDRETTPLRRSEKGLRDRSNRSPLGRPNYVDDKTRCRTTRVSEYESRREADRSAAVGERRAKSPIFSADLHAMIATADAARRSRGLPPHTMESFLLHMHEQVNKP